MSASFRNSIEKITREQIENSAGLFIITSKDYSPASLIQAGRLYQSLVYTCFEQGIGIHPVTQLIQESPWKEEISQKLKTDYPVQFILRTGKLKRDVPDFEIDAVTSASIRMKPEQFIAD